MSQLVLHFLGPTQIEHESRSVRLSSAKAVALLAYLAVTREPQAREHLLGLLWGESSEDAARKNLRNTLWVIRKALGEDAIIGDDDHLSLTDGAWVDVREFENAIDAHAKNPAPGQNLETAISLYHGPFLDDFLLPDSPDLEIWLTTEREHLAQIHLHALANLVNAFRVQGDWQKVIAFATRALEHDALQEPMHRALMEAHARLGARAQALHQYDVLRETLHRELGVEPLPESDALRAAILNGEFDQRVVPARGEMALVSSKRATPPSQAALPLYVGRQAELEALDEEWHEALEEHSRVALLTGEVGIGKSRLWQEWSATLPASVMVLETRCLEATQTLPFAPLIDLITAHPEMRNFSASSPLPKIWLAEIARLIPEMRTTLPDLPPPAALPPDEERHRLFEALAQCFLLSPRAQVLFVDDLHWADHATLDWLDYLVHRMHAHAFLLVTAYRPEDAPAPLVRLAANWGREGLVRRIPLARLTHAESSTLLASLIADAARRELLTERVQTQSSGNPFFLIELARNKSENVPAVLADLLRARLDRLPETARQVLQAAAVLEPDFDFAVLRRTSGRGEEETLDALDVLLDANVLVERGGEYIFSHPLVATVVRESLSGARQVFLHRRAAEALESTHAGRLPPLAGKLAKHYARAGDKIRAANYAELAAEHALSLAAVSEATDFYKQAVALDPTPIRRMALAQTLLRQVDLVGAREAFQAALAGFEALSDKRGAARATLGVAETLFPAGRFDEARQWIRKGLTYLEAQDDPTSHTLAHLMLGSSAMDTGSLDDGENELREAARHAAQADLPDIAARANFSLGNLHAERGDLTNALEHYRASIEFARDARDDFQEALAENNYAYHSLLRGDLDDAHEHIKAGLKIAKARALRLPLQHLYSTRGEIALAEKKWDEAEEWLRRALTEAKQNNNPREIANTRANLGLAARGRGDLDNALFLLDTAREEAANGYDTHLKIKLDLLLAELYLERGERAAANEALTRAETRLAGSARRGLQEWATRLRQNKNPPSH